MNEAHLLSLTSNIGVKQNTVYVKDSQCLGILFEFLFYTFIISVFVQRNATGSNTLSTP